MTIELRSSAFENGKAIPVKHSCDGEDVSPPLEWSGVPKEAKSIALICDDPDAPGGIWVHWVLYGIPPGVAGIEESIPSKGKVIGRARHGQNDFRRLGYGGPCPPKGKAHRYFFKIYALDEELELQAGASKKDLLKVMQGHVMAEGQLVGTYQRE